MSRKREKTWLLATLGALLAIISVIIIWQTHRLLVPWWTIAAVAVPWAGLDIVLRARQRTLGAEGKHVDLWSIPHFGAGVLLGLFDIALVFVIAIATVWEVVEIYARTHEYPTNRVTDVVLAVFGWAAAMLLAGGSFPLV